MSLLYGIAAVAILWWFLRNFTQADPAALAKIFRRIGGIAMLGLAALLGFRGRFELAFLFGGLGAGLLGWGGFRIPGLGGGSTPAPGNVSRVRSALIEMELDHDTGEMDGSVLGGTFAGQRLNALDEASLQRLLAECGANDLDGVRLLEAYLDRRFAGWRDAARHQEHARSGAGNVSTEMTAEQAYQILGLQPGASPDEIRQAHRSLMKKLHPDQGGSTFLAAQVNKAKEILLNSRS